MDVQYFGDDKQETTEPIEISNSNKIISSRKRESTDSVIYKYKYYNKIFGEKK